MALLDARRIPVATYRLQLHGEFTFADAGLLAPYFQAVGITDYYLSPILLSAPGSQHGYDVNDFRKIDKELGGSAEFQRLAEVAAQHRLGLLVDFVPNHMGVNGPFNRWWRDVLECGRHSPYARFFDIYWSDSRARDRPRVLVPVLEDHYGRVLEKGGLPLHFRGGEFELVYGEMQFPLSPNTYGRLLRLAVTGPAATPEEREILELAETFSTLAHPDGAREPERARERAQQVESLKRRLAELCARQPDLAGRIQVCLQQVNGRPGEPGSFDLLDELLENQHYRLARWQAGAQGTNYRRFFAIDSMVGVRMEIPEVFRESHALIGRLIREGTVTGIRLDHIDGLWDPQEYLERLQAIRLEPEEAGPSPPLYVVVEKILEGTETLPESWPVSGTTGYEFIPQLSRLFVDRRTEARFSALYAAFAGSTESYASAVYSKKRLVLESLFAGVVAKLAQSLLDLLKPDRMERDLTGHELAIAVRELLANLGVYRTYRRCGEVMRPADRREIEAACTRAVRRNPRLAPEPFEFVRDLLTGAYRAAGAETQAVLERWVLTFQQYSGAVTAKAVEDTAYYTYNRLIALNEVGDDPQVFGGTVDDFHAANRQRLAATPHSLLTTSTHDTKLSEDVRARLYTLSEIPDEWEAWIREWRNLNRRHKSHLENGRLAPDANEEYRLYQILLGAWPLDDRLDAGFRERIRQYLRKAVSEAKDNTTWHHPNDAWLEAGDHFVNALLDEGPTGDFLASFRPRAQRLAHLGLVNSLAQLVLKITAPGVPDFYQGNEVWDYSLVDPDNRHPVDYERRRRLLAESGDRPWRELLRDWRSGAIKLRVMQALLRFRQAEPELFRAGEYRPAAVRGRFAENVVAFSRAGPGGSALVIVPRLSAWLGCPPLGLVWEDTRVGWEGPNGELECVLTGRRHPGAGEICLADVFAELPLFVAKIRR